MTAAGKKTGTTEKAEAKADPISARTAARVAAVQALYQMDLAGTDLNDVIEEFLSERFDGDRHGETIEGADRTFFADVLRAVVRRQREIDPIVDEQLATGWRLVRVDAILRAVLRAGVAELLDRNDVPARVVINEYINVARFFFSDDEPRVVNGVLDKVAHTVRAKEFEKKKLPKDKAGAVEE
jgi:transcription antitermination protein NusB